MFELLLILLGAYFLGNVKFAKILAKLKDDDITKHGSGNPGTVNMLRTHGFLLGGLTLLLDGLKGAIPALVAYLVFGGVNGGLTAIYAMHLAGFIAVIGHNYPVIKKFKGGKGVATSFGYFTVVNPLLSAILFLVGIVIFAITKIASLGTLSYITGFIIVQMVLNFNIQSVYPLTILVLTAILIFVAHASNMIKLANKQENKFNFAEIIEKDKDFINKKVLRNKKSN